MKKQEIKKRYVPAVLHKMEINSEEGIANGSKVVPEGPGETNNPAIEGWEDDINNSDDNHIFI